MKVANRTRAQKRVQLKSVEQNSTGYLYKLNGLIIFSLTPVSGDVFEIVFPSGKTQRIESLQRAIRIADTLIENIIAFCEKVLVTNVTDEIVEDRFKVLMKRES